MTERVQKTSLMNGSDNFTGIIRDPNLRLGHSYDV